MEGNSDLGALIGAIAMFWGTTWGKVLVILAGLWYFAYRHGDSLIGLAKARREAEAQAEREEAQGELSHIDHLRAQARESREAYTGAVEHRIQALEAAVHEREAKIEELMAHKIECNESLARLEEKYRSLAERLNGYGRAVDQLRSDAVDRERTG